MRLRWRYAYTEACWLLAACILLGSAIGALIALLTATPE